MAQRGPLVTAVVVVAGLVGLMAANASGGLVTAGNTTPGQENVAATGTEDPPVTTEPPAPPVTTTEPPAPPAASTTTDLPAPPEPAFPAEAVFAGRASTDERMALAVAVQGDEASAYLCDGVNVESWLKGTAVDGTVDLKSKDGANTLTGELTGENLNGTIMIAGQPLQFSIAPAQGPAGLYRGDGDMTTLGWILLPDGTQVGIARSASGNAPAPALDPAKGAVTVGGERVSAEKVSGETTFG